MAATLSRRGFARLLGAGFTLAAVPSGAGAGWRTTAGTSPARAALPTFTPVGAQRIRLNSNENPYGPSPAALQAIRDAMPLACRYPDEQADELAAELGAHHGLAADHVLLGAGSSEVLRLAVAAAGSATRRVVTADPTFEAVSVNAKNTGIEVVKVPITADFRHDLPKMLDAAHGAGLVYVCNPNNPTASVTPAAELRAFLAAVPKDTVVLVDEAYHHFASGAGYETVTPLVAELPNLLVARTFSKIYGMAGLRCGYGVAQPALLARLRAQQAWDSANLMALVAASASLADPAYVEASRQRNLAVREECCDSLRARGLHVIPSQANFFMVELGREVKPVIAALRDRGVEVGRLFPALPTHLRVTVGTREEMQAFLAAFDKVMPKAA
ncbi:MAG TPA: histidinol-phosphate transaminase [Thermoanaerobaculia bacterium]|jgi:histidinol-phosphate aminotransferase|nr:histidinol-phosphate transaminase [Thermoanaerobaculia bacterium]